MYVDKSRTYIGVVEDNNDPKKIGRCRIRVVDIFDDIPVDDIPWASPWKDINGNSFNVPDKGKIVTVVFDSGNIYKPEYIYADHYNTNLEKKLESLSGSDYTSMRALVFDHKTQIFSNDKDGLILDYKFNNINIKDSSIDVNLKDNYGKITLGDAKSDQQAILGTNFMNWFDQFVDNLLGTQGGPYIGNMGSPITPNPSMVAILQAYQEQRDPKFLSNNVYITSNYKISTVSDNKDNRQNSNQLGDDYKSSNDGYLPSKNVDNSGDDYSPQVDPNLEANTKFDPEDKTSKSKPVYIDPDKGPSSGIISDFAKEMVRISQTQLGIFENPKNSNSGPEVEGLYQRSTFLKGTGWPWCAAFVCYLFKTAASKQGIQHSFKLPLTAGAYDFENWARNNSPHIQIIKAPFNQILPGDVIIFNFGHIGLSISEIKNGKIDCIEGNTDDRGSREGGGVYKKSRKLGLIKTVLRISYNNNLVTQQSV